MHANTQLTSNHVQKEGKTVLPEIMIPLVGFARELELQLEVVHRVAAEEQATIRNQQTLDKLEVLVKEHNYGPVAARCAVIGWGIDKKDRNLCAEAMRLHHAN